MSVSNVINVGGGLNPIGTIINFMGTIAPDGYLFCDGTEYNISDYQNLADFFELQFGSKNKFGGDGTTTFKVPDLQGEFLRCTGTNGHSGQGSGANVGVHQDATVHTELNTDANSAYITKSWIDHKADSRVGTDLSYGRANLAFDSTTAKNFTSRPTNTSVMYCIKY